MENEEVVKVTISEIKGKCPIFKIGDEFVIRNQRLDTNLGTAKEFCIHGLTCIYGPVLFARKSQKGSKSHVQCWDPEGSVIFQLEKM